MCKFVGPSCLPNVQVQNDWTQDSSSKNVINKAKQGLFDGIPQGKQGPPASVLAELSIESADVASAWHACAVGAADDLDYSA